MNYQEIVESLECFKRNLGRQYDRTHNPFTGAMYNRVDDQITELVTNHSCKRLSKPYKIRLAD